MHDLARRLRFVFIEPREAARDRGDGAVGRGADPRHSTRQALRLLAGALAVRALGGALADAHLLHREDLLRDLLEQITYTSDPTYIRHTYYIYSIRSLYTIYDIHPLEIALCYTTPLSFQS